MNRRSLILGGLFGFSSAYAAPPWYAAFKDVDDGFGWTELPVEGQLPKDLKGTLMRAGPMRFHSADGIRYGHWFDGDGGVVSVEIDKGSARGSMRVLQTEGLLLEQKLNKRVYSGYDTRSKRAWWNILRGQFKTSPTPVSSISMTAGWRW